MLLLLRTHLDYCVTQCHPAALLTQGVEKRKEKNGELSGQCMSCGLWLTCSRRTCFIKQTSWYSG